MLVIDDLLFWLPGKALTWVIKQVYEQVVAEWQDPDKIKQQLFELQLLYELDEITLEQYEAREAQLLSRLGFEEELDAESEGLNEQEECNT